MISAKLDQPYPVKVGYAATGRIVHMNERNIKTMLEFLKPIIPPAPINLPSSNGVLGGKDLMASLTEVRIGDGTECNGLSDIGQFLE